MNHVVHVESTHANLILETHKTLLMKHDQNYQLLSTVSKEKIRLQTSTVTPYQLVSETVSSFRRSTNHSSMFSAWGEGCYFVFVVVTFVAVVVVLISSETPFQ